MKKLCQFSCCNLEGRKLILHLLYQFLVQNLSDIRLGSKCVSVSGSIFGNLIKESVIAESTDLEILNCFTIFHYVWTTCFEEKSGMVSYMQKFSKSFYNWILLTSFLLFCLGRRLTFSRKLIHKINQRQFSELTLHIK